METVHVTVAVVDVRMVGFSCIPVLRGLGAERNTVIGDTKWVPVSVTVMTWPCIPRLGEIPVIVGGGGKILKLSVDDAPPGVETPTAQVATVDGSVNVAVAVVESITLMLLIVTPTQLETFTRNGDPTKAVPSIVTSTLVPAIPDAGDIDVIVGDVFLACSV
jgi:hypothetical protein